MKLSQMLAPDYIVPPELDEEFDDMVTDSRDLSYGDLFVLTQVDETRRKPIIDDALSKKPVAILVDAEESFQMEQGDVPVFCFPNLSEHVEEWLHQVYPHAHKLRLVGVTGTNGKSSTTHYLAQLLDYVSKPCGLIGTLGNGVYPDIGSTRNTTSDLATSLSVLNKAYESGAQIAAIEVSSHGIEQNRLKGLEFELVVFTNLSQDHLDYHGSMDAYFATKKSFINQPDVPVALICIDDEYGQSLINDAKTPNAFSYGQHAQADIRYELVSTTAKGIVVKIVSPWGEAQTCLPLLGEFNAANAIAALACACVLGVEFEQAVTGLSSLKPAAGRMQVFNKSSADSVTAVVDFAHTPDALARALQALMVDGKKPNLVFGCGGNRDKSKRALMALAAKEFAHQIWLTDDNPRDENPEDIFADVLSASGASTFNCEHNREQAIKQALKATSAGEILLIAGKGHENYQEVKGIKQPYSDEKVLESLGFIALGNSVKGGANVS